MTESRLDAAVAALGLARSRTHAAKLIADGAVTVDGTAVLKVATKVTDTQVIAVSASDHYVSRAAHKLIAALDAFDITVAGRFVLDVGASTGGFSQVLLERGATQVIAADVGHGQLAPLVAEDPRVVSVEGLNVRYLTAAALAEATGVEEVPSLVVGDLSFISLTMVLPALVGSAAPDADLVLLIKPQFEVGRTRIKEGIVHDADRREDAITGVLWAAWDCGLGTAGIMPSPMLGSHGNHEYLVWLSASAGTHPTEWLRQIRTMVGV
ncbi:TlyA family RNA methyltransferase [Rathayibacter soli]|uniref:TlyA family RNA methyltransferase n=1 Tax=Rathayibacter soli TaxID=3144168 RepID=UPI0027E48CF6|nr:TlyA family RNA methyltransferase [Glaciibacter superstes]